MSDQPSTLPTTLPTTVDSTFTNLLSRVEPDDVRDGDTIVVYIPSTGWGYGIYSVGTARRTPKQLRLTLTDGENLQIVNRHTLYRFTPEYLDAVRKAWTLTTITKRVQQHRDTVRDLDATRVTDEQLHTLMQAVLNVSAALVGVPEKKK